jgi:hypothetical protein
MLKKKEVKRLVIESFPDDGSGIKLSWSKISEVSNVEALVRVDEKGKVTSQCGVYLNDFTLYVLDLHNKITREIAIFEENKDLIRMAIKTYFMPHSCKFSMTDKDKNNFNLSLMIGGNNEEALKEIADYAMKVCKEKGLNLLFAENIKQTA